MARMGRGHYILITEAMGLAINDVRSDNDSVQFGAWKVVNRMADALAADSPGFNRELFIENVQQTAELARLAQEGINL